MAESQEYIPELVNSVNVCIPNGEKISGWDIRYDLTANAFMLSIAIVTGLTAVILSGLACRACCCCQGYRITVADGGEIVTEADNSDEIDADDTDDCHFLRMTCSNLCLKCASWCSSEEEDIEMDTMDISMIHRLPDSTKPFF